jgi:hypothetical protein
MPRLHVLDVPEFAGLVATARENPTVDVSSARNGYLTISSDDELVFDRREAGFKPAVWYSCCSGGVDGTIVEFGRDVLRIGEAKRAR